MTLTGNLSVAPLAPLKVIEHVHDDVALVFVGHLQAVQAVGSVAVQNGLTQQAVGDLAHHALLVVLAVGVVSVEAVCQPIVFAVKEHDGRRKN